MGRDPRAPERMTRAELVAEVKRLRNQQQLEHSRDVYADLYDHAPLPYVTLDQWGVVRNINITGSELLGRPRRLVEGAPFSRHIQQADRRKFLDHMRRCRTESGLVGTDLTLVVARGEAVPVQITSRGSIPPASVVTEYRTVIIDLRLLRTAEAAQAHAERDRMWLMREEERLRAAMEAKDEFLAILSHELRTPLTPILAIVSALRSRADLSPALRDEFGRIQRNVELETRLIDDLLDMTRAARGTLALSRQIIDLHQLLRETVELCEADRPPDVLITWSLGAAEHHVHADPLRLRQVVWNLVRNAFQSIDGVGEVLLRSINDRPGQISVAVRDSGHGIHAADLDRIFLPFYQPGGGHRGRLGLGLTISKSLVEAHGGRIAASSAGDGRGACFEVDLSVVASGASDGQSAVPPPLPAPTPVAILLVEDNIDSAAALSEALRLEGFEVRLADSVSAAREAARERFDVLVSDLALPDGSGWDLITELRAHSAVPAIALSGFGSETDKNRSAAAGFSAHLTKPVTIERLSEAIRRLVPPS
jgi:signal transduction histidine kinase/CheY-like chemotaxis protein